MPDRQKPGRWITHPADRVNATRALVAPFLLFAPFAVNWFSGYEIIYAIVTFVAIGETNYLLHLHIHRPFSRNPALNILFDLSMGAVTGMTASNWRIQHVYGHHRGFDRPYRGERSAYLQNYSAMRAVTYSAISLFETIYAPIVESFNKGILDKIKTPISYRWAFFEQMLLLGFVAILIVFSPQGERHADKTYGGNPRYQQPRQFRNRFADQDGHTHLRHKRGRHTDHDGRGAITRCQHAGRVEQFVADNFCEKDCPKGGEENYQQFSGSASRGILRCHS